MQVQVVDRLSAIVSGIDHHAIPFLELLRPRQIRCDRH
jgi:hypothetical protein